MPEPARDRWAEWLLERRHGGDPEDLKATLDFLGPVRAPADDLSAVGDTSVDAVTTRSVLIYVQDRRRAFEEFYCVPKPGGRLSIFEPINSFAYPEPPDRFHGFEVTPVRDLARKVRSVYEGIQSPDSDPMLDFDERDLFDMAESAGFKEVFLNYEAELTSGEPRWSINSWEQFLKVAGNLRIPTLGDAMEQALTTEESGRFTDYLRPRVEQARRRGRSAANAYLWAIK